MVFDPCNCSLKIWESIETPTPKMKVHLGVWGSYPHTLLHFWEHECDSWALFLARTFASPCLGYEPKARVMTRNAIISRKGKNIFNQNQINNECVEGLLHQNGWL
jgi:hypothetical protein